MGWLITDDAGEFLTGAGAFLRSRAAENTVLLTAAENVRAGAGTAGTAGSAGADGGSPLFGWWRDGGTRGAVAGAFLHTPPFPVALTAAPAGAAAALAATLTDFGRGVPGVNGVPGAATEFAAGWRQATGAGSQVERNMRLYRLAGLTPPDPPPGRARKASGADRGLLLAWYEAFSREVHERAGLGTGAIDDRLGYGGLMLWEVDGQAVSLAGLTRIVAGMVRVGPVYTPPRLRGRGYAGAVTGAVSRAALAAGAREVVLFTDLANPTSNALYQRLGYRPVRDHLVLSFTGASPETKLDPVR